jgi:hypothetical protein
MTSIVDNGGGKVAQPFNLQDLERLQTCHVMVGLSPTWVAITCRKILETVNHIQSETEEYVIIHINLLLFLLIWIQWR